MGNLIDSQVRAAKPGLKPIKMADGGGLTFVINPNGTKLWRLRYRREGKEQQASLGLYPEVSLAAARQASADLRQMRRAGVDPVSALRARRASAGQLQAEEQAADKALRANTFAVLADQYIEKRAPNWSVGHAERFRNRIEKDVNPEIGDMPVRDITPRIILDILRKIEGRGAVDTAHRVKGMIGAVMGYATALDMADGDPTALLTRAMASSPPVKSRAAITDPERLGIFLEHLEAWQGDTLAKPLLQVIIHTFQRPGEVRMMRWSEIDWDRKLWNFKVSKVGVDHSVPLSNQVIEILQGLKPITGGRVNVFSLGQKPLSDAMPMQIIDKLGYRGETTAHGFRATARTIIAERLKFDPRYIELQLSHAVPEVHGTAYNRALYIEERTMMMQRWSDYLDQVRNGQEGTERVLTLPLGPAK